MKINFKSYWVWYYTATLLLSVADYIDHITRADDRFLQIWLSWFAFTFGAVTLVILLTYGINLLLQKPLKKALLIAELLAVFIPYFIHIRLTGPLLDMIIFGGGTLNFFATTSIYILPITIFLIIRALHWLIIIRPKAQKSSL